jgi:hypothetical protein
MVPFLSFDWFWQTGLAGSIVSGAAYIISAIYLYRLTRLITNNRLTAWIAFAVFALNPNVLYMQTTPMTELPLVCFFLLSSFYFVRFIKGVDELRSLILASFFGFCAVLSRYDGWLLVLVEATAIILLFGRERKYWKKLQGLLILFCTLSFFGILMWFAWDYLILGDPLYFTNSQFSAKSQQMGWLAKGQLPAYHNLSLSFAYYFVTTMSNVGLFVFGAALVGFLLFISRREEKNRGLVALILLVPFIFYVVTLFLGQSIIFIPHLTPVGFEWRLFNVRYGVMMIPVVAFFFAYAFGMSKKPVKLLLIFLFVAQFGLYLIGYSKVITYTDGVEGLSSGKRPDAEAWLAHNYDGGRVLLDDYARTLSIIRSGILMQNVIYVGNKPYWEESLKTPEKYARWVIMQKDDAVWKEIYQNPEIQGRLYAYFQKVYTSPEILIFKRAPQ